jgi:hypothetical protein
LKTTRKIVLAAVLTCASAAAPGTARALSCATNWVQAPRDGERDVPTNTRIWAHGRFGGASPARLIGPAGEVAVDEHFMPVAIGPGQGTNYPVLVPRAELEPDTRYAIEITYDRDEPDADVTERVWFTTGSGPTTAAPAAPALVSIEPGATDSSWGGGSQRWLSLGFAPHAGLLIADTAGALGSVSSADDLFVAGGSFEAVEVSATAPVIRWFSADEVVAVGQGDCLIWPENGIEQQSARFGVLDLAGNFSGWTAAELELPSSEEARAIITAQEAAEQADEDEVARERARIESDRDMFDNHQCSVGPGSGASASPGAGRHVAGWTLALGAALLRARRRRPSRRH